MRKVIIILILLLVGTYLTCTKQKQVFRSEPKIEYYPLRVGNYWEYGDNSNMYEYHLRKEIVEFCLLQEGLGVYKARYLSSHSYSKDTVEHKEEWFSYQALIGNEIREFSDLSDLGQYEILLRFPLQVGSSWKEPSKQMDSVWIFSIFIDSVVAVENVITPAGEFDDCFKISSGMGGFDFMQSEKWFKPQVGFVKFTNGLGPLEYSLVDYKIMK